MNSRRKGTRMKMKMRTLSRGKMGVSRRKDLVKMRISSRVRRVAISRINQAVRVSKSNSKRGTSCQNSARFNLRSSS
jgi:hypothetical protein